MPPSRPNILFLFSDQQHWQAAGFEDDFFRTPNLDRLAAQGAVFARSFCTTPQCSPSRSSILTGLYPHKTAVIGNVGAAGGQPLRSETVGALLQRGGYRTAYFGKWHLGWDAAGTAGWDEGIAEEKGEKINDELTTQRAVDFLGGRGGDRPFALFLSYNDPHGVYHAQKNELPESDEPIPLPNSWHAETFAGKPAVQRQFMTDDQGRSIVHREGPKWQAYRQLYRRRVEMYDAHLGRVLAELESRGLAESTVVMATSDHGDMDANHRLVFKGPFMYEHMMRVPLVIRVPPAFGGRAPARVDADVVNVDLVPTVLDFACLPAIACDGQSLHPCLTGAGAPPRRDFVIGQYYSKQKWVNPIRMIRTSRWKYNLYITHGEELYDLQSDGDELTNLAADGAHAAVKADLRAKLDEWIRAHNDPFHSLRSTTRQGEPLDA